MEQPLVSIVTPSFNQGRFIRQTIESVLSQDYPRIEYLVVDGGSTDETLEILRSYGDRLTWVSEPDRGQADAINKGWRGARGEILAYLNSDDFYLPGAVSRAVRFLSERPDLVAVYGEAWHSDETGHVWERYPTEAFDRQRLKEICYICQPATFLRRHAVARVGYLDESLRYCMDYDLWLRLLQVGPLGHLPEYLAVSRLYGDNKTMGQRVQVHVEIMDMLRRHQGFVDPAWIYGYAHAVLRGFEPRSSYVAEARFLLGLFGISLREFIRYNRRLPLNEVPRWLRWLRRAGTMFWREVRAGKWRRSGKSVFGLR
jgi:glycosyltransferase involved in cell wall biosynthesis